MNRRFHPLPALLALLFAVTACGYHKPVVKTLPNAERTPGRILFIAFDGVSYDMMRELKAQGHFRDFQEPVPLVVPFPSATTIGFTGIFKPLNVGPVPGYESRFYSYKDDRVVGGTPWDIYKIHIPYKSYFHAFRHTMLEKSVMYSLPGMAGQQDLMRAEKLVMKTDKKIMFAYLGGTDGAQHILGEHRTKRFMVFVDRFLTRMKKRYEAKGGEPLQIVLFSDHGFHYDKLKMVWSEDIQKAVKADGFKVANHLKSENDVLLVKYGLLSAGVVITKTPRKRELARGISRTEGMDLVFWPEGERVHMLTPKGEEAYFEYRWPRAYRYVAVKGDPLKYLPTLRAHGHRGGEWIPEKTWHRITARHEYPEAGYRLYDSFHNLVENKASLLFSLRPNYQFGGLAALAGTKLKFGGHKGTHGGLFRDVSHGVTMTDARSVKLPEAFRYDQFFHFFLPHVTRAYQSKAR